MNPAKADIDPCGISLNPRELATVLAALRIYQSTDVGARGRMSHFYRGILPLDNFEVDVLCERLNYQS